MGLQNSCKTLIGVQGLVTITYMYMHMCNMKYMCTIFIVHVFPLDVCPGCNSDVNNCCHYTYMYMYALLVALCCRTFKERCLVFLHTKKAVHRLRIVFGLLGLNATELHGNLTQLQVQCYTCTLVYGCVSEVRSVV